MAKQLAICTTQSTFDIIHICNMHMEADHSHRKFDNSNVSHNKPDQSCGNIAINVIVSMYNELSVLLVLNYAQVSANNSGPGISRKSINGICRYVVL